MSFDFAALTISQGAERRDLLCSTVILALVKAVHPSTGFTNSSSLPWFSPELKPHPWLLLFWCAFPPASPAACLWPQQGTNSMLASNLISHAVYYLLFCSICHLLATRLPRDMSGGCMIHSITQSKIFSISLMAFCFSF